MKDFELWTATQAILKMKSFARLKADLKKLRSHALRKSGRLERRDQEKLEKLIERWILDPSSFVGPDGDMSNLFFQKEAW